MASLLASSLRLLPRDDIPSPEALAILSKKGKEYLGPMVFAFLIDVYLLGLLTSSAVTYWRQFGDRFKYLIALLVLTNIAQSCIVCHTSYIVFAVGFGDWSVHFESIYFQAILATEAVACFFAQLFFLERAFTLLKLHKTLRWVFMGITIPGSLASVASGLASSIVCSIYISPATDFQNWAVLKALISAWKGTSVVTDVIITGTLITCLLSRRSDWNETDSKLQKLVRFIIEAQSLPLIAGVFFLASYVADPNANLCLIPSLSEGKLATISVLHVLNCRTTLRRPSSFQLGRSTSSRENRLNTVGRLNLGVPGKDPLAHRSPRPISPTSDGDITDFPLLFLQPPPRLQHAEDQRVSVQSLPFGLDDKPESDEEDESREVGKKESRAGVWVVSV